MKQDSGGQVEYKQTLQLNQPNIPEAQMTEASRKIQDYYLYNYSVHCPRDDSIFQTWQYEAYTAHFTVITLLPLYTFGGYCILKKTPKQMESLKWVYFNLHFWVSFLDILMCTLITPYFFLPSLSGVSLGLFQLFGIGEGYQTYMGLTTVTMVGSSMVALFENRQHLIINNIFRIQNSKVRYSLLAFNYILGATFFIPFLFDIPEQTGARLATLELIPCPSDLFFKTQVFVLSTLPSTRENFALVVFIVVSIISTQVVFYNVICSYYLVFTSSKVSKKTVSLQRQFFMMSVIQVFIPASFFLPLIGYMIFVISFNYYNQSLNCSLTLLLSMHGFTSTFICLYINAPYRNYVKSLFPKWRSSITPVVFPPESVGRTLSVVEVT